MLVTLLFSWVSVGLATALMGAWVLLRGDAHGIALREPHAPIDRGRAHRADHADLQRKRGHGVCRAARHLRIARRTTGALPLFDIYVLSDTSDPALRAAEQQAWERLRRTLGDGAVGEGGRVFYRWRRRRTRRKAGNVSEFLGRRADDYHFMIGLDADSLMSGETMRRLIRLMEENPRIGAIQTISYATGRETLFARIQQFAVRLYAPLALRGLEFWQGPDGTYWGHNAILRTAPFRDHCTLPVLPWPSALRRRDPVPRHGGSGDAPPGGLGNPHPHGRSAAPGRRCRPTSSTFWAANAAGARATSRTPA